MAATRGADGAADATTTEPGAAAPAQSGLDEAVEQVNRQIDNDVKAMLDSFEALVKLSLIKDKDQLRIAQERFEAEARADVMVRAAQSLTLLSQSLKLSLLLSQVAVGAGATTEDGQGEPAGQKDAQETDQSASLDDEAVALIDSMARSREQCAQMLKKIFAASTAKDAKVLVEDTTRDSNVDGSTQEGEDVSMQMA